MLIVAIAWLYVVILMAATQPTWLAAIATLVFYGIFPLSIVLYLIATPARARRRRRQIAAGNPANAESVVPSEISGNAESPADAGRAGGDRNDSNDRSNGNDRSGDNVVVDESPDDTQDSRRPRTDNRAA